MSRNKTDIKTQLNMKLNTLLRIGTKKVVAPKGSPHWNPNRGEGIRSIQTADTYRRSINIFADFCKKQGIRHIDKITKDVIQQFFSSRSHLSSWTHMRYLSALNKVLGTFYGSKDFGIPPRKQKNIVNNRGIRTKNNTAHKPKNWPALLFVLCTGCRRSSILTVTSDQAIRTEDGLIIGFTFKEKGGRVRNALLIPSMREAITRYVNDLIERDGEHCKLLTYCDAHCNPHRMRAAYTHQLYHEMQEYRDRGEDIYMGYRHLFIDEARLEKALSHPRYQRDMVQGFETKLCAEISQQIGHNRIEVTLNSYLRVPNPIDSRLGKPFFTDEPDLSEHKENV